MNLKILIIPLALCWRDISQGNISNRKWTICSLSWHLTSFTEVLLSIAMGPSFCSGLLENQLLSFRERRPGPVAALLALGSWSSCLKTVLQLLRLDRCSGAGSVSGLPVFLCPWQSVSSSLPFLHPAASPCWLLQPVTVLADYVDKFEFSFREAWVFRKSC